MSEIKKPGDSQGVRTQVWDPGEPQDRMLSEAVSLGMKKVRTSATIHASGESTGCERRAPLIQFFHCHAVFGENHVRSQISPNIC